MISCRQDLYVIKPYSPAVLRIIRGLLCGDRQLELALQHRTVKVGQIRKNFRPRARVRMSPESRLCGPLPEIRIVMKAQA